MDKIKIQQKSKDLEPDKDTVPFLIYDSFPLFSHLSIQNIRFGFFIENMNPRRI